MKRRLLATFLSLCLLVGLLPTVALATDEEPGAEPTPVCTCESFCTEGAADETCPVCAEDYTLCTYAVARQFFCETRTEFLRKNSPVLRSKSETRSLASTAP